jgi:hypothetical protein
MKSLLQKHGIPVAIVAILCSLPSLYFLFSGRLPGNWDVFNTLLTGQSPPNRPYDILQSDACLQFYLWRDLVFESWRHFEVPTWNPYVLGGAPLLANSQSGALYPPHILVGVLGIPTGVGINLLGVFHQMVFGIGMYAVLIQLCRDSEEKQILAGTGAITASLSMFMVQWLSIPSVGTTLAWLPWILVGMLQFFEGCRHWRTWVFVGVGSCFMILGGHLQFAAYGFIGALVWGISFCATHSAWKFAWKPLLAVVAGIILSWPQLGKVLEFSQESHRRSPATAEGWMAYSGSTAEGPDFAYLFNPIARGSMSAPLADTGLPTFMPALTKPWKNTADLAINVSPILFVAMLIGFRKCLKTALPGMVVSLAGLLLILPSPLLQAMFFAFPGWSATGSPGRAACLMVLGVILAGIPALGGMKLTENEGDPKGFLWISNRKLALSAFLGFAIAIWSIFFPSPFPNISDSEPLGIAIQMESANQFGGNLGIGFILVVGVIAGVVSSARDLRKACGITLGFVLLVAITHSPPSGPAPSLTTSTTQGERIAFLNSQPNFLQAPSDKNLPNLPALSRTMIINGYDSLVSRDTVEMLREINGEDPAALVNGNMMLIKQVANIEALKEAGVTKIIARDGMVQDIGGPGIVSLDGVPATNFEIIRSRVKIKDPGAGELTVRMRNIKGWKALVDDKHMEIPAGRWIKLTLQPGTKTVELRYAP